ncbi:MAG: hypothetical protein COB50_03775, partial [Thiotrichales bacterium]
KITVATEQNGLKETIRVSTKSYLISLLKDINPNTHPLRYGLLNLIERSKRDKTVTNAAANAITVLVKYGFDFSKKNLIGVNITGADISNGVFRYAGFCNANLSNVTAYQVDFTRVRLTESNLIGIDFGQKTYSDKIKEKDEKSDISSAIVSADSNTLAVQTVNNEVVWVIDTFTDKSRGFALIRDKHKVTAKSIDNLNKEDKQLPVSLLNFLSNTLLAVYEKTKGTSDNHIYLVNPKEQQYNCKVINVPHTRSLVFKVIQQGNDYNYWYYGNKKIKLYDHNVASKSIIEVPDDINDLDANINILSISSNNHLVALSTKKEQSITVWSLRKNSIFNKNKINIEPRHKHECSYLQFYEDLLAISFTDGLLQIWDIKRQNKVYSSKGNGDIKALSFFEDGEKFSVLTTKAMMHFFKFDTANLQSESHKNKPDQLSLIGTSFIANGQNKCQMSSENKRLLKQNNVLDGGILAKVNAGQIDEKILNNINELVKPLSLTPLMLAVIKGDTLLIRTLLQCYGVDVNKTNDGWTALMCAVRNIYAAKNKYTKAVELLLEAGAKVNQITKDMYTPLIIASEHSHIGIVKLLLKAKGIDVNETNKSGGTALVYASHGGHFEVVKQLLEAKAEVNQADKDNCTALMYASKNGHVEVVKQLLEAKAEVNLATKLGYTGLILASENGHLEVVKQLLEAKAEVNQADKDNWTALMCASQNGHFEVVKQLLEAKAEVNQADKDNWTALMYASKNGHVEVVKQLLKTKTEVNQADKDNWTALMLASHGGHVEVVKQLLEAKAEVNLANNNWTALMYASQNGHFEVVKQLLEAKAEINEATKDNVTALMSASKNGHFEVVKQLIKAGAKINEVYKNGMSSLMYASQNGHMAAVKKLLESGAKVNQEIINGDTALFIALEAGHVEVAKCLLDSGAYLDKICPRGITLHATMQNKSDKIIALITKHQIPKFALIKELSLAIEKQDLTTINVLLSKWKTISSLPVLLWSIMNKCKETNSLLEEKKLLNTTDTVGNTSLMCAAIVGDIESATTLLKLKSTNINQQNKIGIPALNFASKNGCSEIVAMLLGKKNIKVNLANYHNSTALTLSCAYNRVSIVKLLLKHKSININFADNDGDTPLICAVDQKQEYHEIVDILLQSGANTNVKNNGGKTALSIAKAKKYLKIIKLLEDYPVEQKRATLEEKQHAFQENKQKEKQNIIDSDNKKVDNAVLPLTRAIQSFKSNHPNEESVDNA